MGHTGEELGADCVDLWQAGNYELKPLGAQFRDAAAQLARTEECEYNFWRDTKLGGPYGPVRQVWADFRDEVVDILRQTAENLELTGDALILAANRYADTDEDAKRTFTDLKPAVIEAHKDDGMEPPR
ncbi:hypothetical protein [Planosporangium mesophilum]|uniref:Uncharacterized protein n=1 Tax=Planosporangium mesophilum TaxID=689768 RepID=A0A8J3WZK8_9ACTN|nr:hypothetical protein [Planosporangium mesophilum]NJC83377.1 hypothetical protein [Planosporangium mesophilum]GII21756.1 hypothetical protein Pme01_13530 [Planosporangium mesophilum]